jgi:hypothetical protein
MVSRRKPLYVETDLDVHSPGRKEVSPVLSETRYEHIILDEAQAPLIAGTRVKVIELVLDHLAYGWSPEELHFQHPHLTMGQILTAQGFVSLKDVTLSTSPSHDGTDPLGVGVLLGS